MRREKERLEVQGIDAPSETLSKRFNITKRLFSENPLTLRQIDNQLNLSRERVWQIEGRLKEKLRVCLDEEVENLESLRESIIDV